MDIWYIFLLHFVHVLIGPKGILIEHTNQSSFSINALSKKKYFTFNLSLILKVCVLTLMIINCQNSELYPISITMHGKKLDWIQNGSHFKEFITALAHILSVATNMNVSYNRNINAVKLDILFCVYYGAMFCK